jgi:hypothetical protein
MTQLRRAVDGQAMVETAIVAPLFIFMVLGILQWTLVNEAQSMLKYAAYRAARSGAMNNACNGKMTSAALAALVPEIALGDSLLRSDDAVTYALSWEKVKWTNRYLGPAFLRIVDVRVCGPLKAWLEGDDTARLGDAQEVDFDDPRNVFVSSAPASPDALSQGATLRGFERTKLRVQVKFHFKMIIPFANQIIFRSWLGQRVSDTLRYNDKGSTSKGQTGSSPRIAADVGKHNARESAVPLRVEAEAGNFYLPLYASYAFRMQSNFFLKACPLPEKNLCWHYSDGTATGAP